MTCWTQTEKPRLDGLPVPALDALVRGLIESHLDPSIAAHRGRSRGRDAGRGRPADLRLEAGFSRLDDETDSPDTSEDWAWAR